MRKNSLELAQEWAKNPYFDAAFRAEIQQLIDQDNAQEIEERFYKDIEFGTGGLRSILGAGPNRMNLYAIRRATHAISLEVLKAEKPAGVNERRVAISYDCRHFSFEFAKEAASIFAAHGIHAYIYKRLNPVPLLSFSIRHHKALAGVMVTASHNPPNYNGYKVYWSDGAQVTPPYDQRIIQNYNAVEDFNEIPLISFEQGLERGFIHWVGEDVEQAYINAIAARSLNADLIKANPDLTKIVFTSIHGASLIPCLAALKAYGFQNVSHVVEQEKPDGDFPTVKSPNPENPEALLMAVEQMKRLGADLAMGSDPDGDRLGVAVLGRDGQVHYPNGNQIGLLMLHYTLKTLADKGQLSPDSYFVKTIVTTPLQEKIATSFGVETFNTLTGFKWICGKMKEQEIKYPHKKFLFATEESFGYLNHDLVRDKDGVSSVTLMSEIAHWYKKTQNKNLMEALDAIYEEFGFAHETLLSLDYFGKEGALKIERIMQTFRELNPQELSGVKIVGVEDYMSLETQDLQSGQKSPIDLPKSNVLGLQLESGDKIYLRPSGTEPKIKFYIMTQVNSGTLEEKKKISAERTQKFLTDLRQIADRA